MRILSKEGKFLGLINIIDLFVLIIIIGLLGFGAYRILNKNPEAQISSVNLVLELEAGPVRSITVDNINVDDEIWDSDKGYKLGTIIEKKVEPYMENVQTADGRIVKAEVPEEYKVLLKVKCDQVVETQSAFTINGFPIQIGGSISTKTKYILTRMRIIGIHRDY